MPNWPLFVLAMALALVLLGVLATVVRYRLWIAEAQIWQVVDASDLELPPPPAVRVLVADLAALGFRRVGEGGRPDLAAQVGPAQIWYFADEDGTTCAGVFAAGPYPTVVLYSWFNDQAVIVTAHPQGEHIDEPDFRFHTVASSVTDAYQHHREQLPDFEDRYGAASRLDNMTEVLRLEALYNSSFARRRQKPILLRELHIPIFQLYLIAVALGLFVALQVLHLPLMPVLAVTGLLVVPAVALFVATRRRRQREQ